MAVGSVYSELTVSQLTTSSGFKTCIKAVSCLLLIGGALALAASCKAQQQPAKSQPNSTGGGVASGGLAPAVYDAQRRPITAGGFVENGPRVFEDITSQAGLANWHHKMGMPDKKLIVETNGSGVCLIDYDNDGWLDIYLVNGSTFGALDGRHSSLARSPVNCS